MVNLSPDMGRDVNINLTGTTFGNYVWTSFQTTMAMDVLDMDLNVYRHYFINVQDGIARVITILPSGVFESVEEILEMFGFYKGEVQWAQ